MAARGVFVYASKEGGPEWQYEWLIHGGYSHRLVGHGDEFSVGNIEFRAVHTPGHTPEHLSYLVRDAGSGVKDFIALASGDFVFVGDVGRPGLEVQRARGRAHVLDVRGAAEFEAGHVPGALHVPHTRIGVNADALPTDKPLLVYCNSGARAAAAVAMLERLGLTAIDVNDNFANYRRDHVAAHA
jgi:rhodanese-related sulfurtransferase